MGRLILSLVSFLPLTVKAAPQPQTINCTSQPGQAACREMRWAYSTLVDCDGSSCHSLWREQIMSMDTLTRWYYDNINLADRAQRDVADEAYRLAAKICLRSYEGDADWISRITVSINRVMPVLESLQLMGGITTPKTCTFSNR